MATYIKTLKEDNGDITYPQTTTDAVLTTSGTTLETELGKCVKAEEIGSTADITPTITTAMIKDSAVTTAKLADGSVTSAKIDWTTLMSGFADKVFMYSGATTTANTAMTTVPAGKYFVALSTRFATTGTEAWATSTLIIGGSAWANDTASCFVVNDGHTPVVSLSRIIEATADTTVGVKFSVSGSISVQSCRLSVFGIKA